MQRPDTLRGPGIRDRFHALIQSLVEQGDRPSVVEREAHLSPGTLRRIAAKPDPLPNAITLLATDTACAGAFLTPPERDWVTWQLNRRRR